LGTECGIRPRLGEGRLQLLARRHQRLRDVLAAELAEPPPRRGRLHQLRHARSLRQSYAPCSGSVSSTGGAAAFAAAMNARSLRGSFLPGDTSTPVQTSTPQGRTAAIASATLSVFRPPARMSGTPGGAPS